MAEGFTMNNHSTDEVRPIKVICIGAGISGIISAIRLPEKIPNLELRLYEKSEDIGGTWLDNHYPGIACDIPAAAYQLSFESNTQWSAYFAPGGEIKAYWDRVCAKWDVYRYVTFNTQVTEARWNEETCKWTVQLKDVKTGQTTHDSGDILISATGILNAWKWPDIPGLFDFKGHIVHTANWDHSYDLKGKKIALVGGGSSGIQILPEIQPIVERCDHYMRGKTWIAYRVPGKEYPGMNPEDLENFKHSEEELEKFRNDPNAYLEFRCAAEDALNSAPDFIWNGSETQKQAEELFEKIMKSRLEKKPEVYEALKPSYPPGCRRLTPGPGYLKAIVEDNVDFISCGIKEVTETGVIDNNGALREVDAIICATGFDYSLKPRIPTYGLGGVTLGEVWDPVPEAYLSMCPAKMPNYFLYLGPNGGPGTGSTIVFLEAVSNYICKAVAKIQREGLSFMVPKQRAITQFGQYVDKYMENVVYGLNCRSWFKRNDVNSRVVYVYPGGSMSALYVLQNPRWEDFDYGHTAETNINMWGWLGNGTTMAQRDGKSTSDYLRNADIPPVPKMQIENEDSTEASGVVAKTNGIKEAEETNDLNGVKSNASGFKDRLSNITALMDVIGNAFLSLKNE
ncbi:uncharacterized protein TRUGW13939_09903, partial [Talaromyces rugulosus]